MAKIYVDDTATGANDGTTKADAFTSWDNVGVDGAAAGSDIWLAHTHNESIGATTTLNFGLSTQASPIRIMSVNFGTDAFEAGAKLSITNVGADLSIIGFLRGYGLVFDVNDDLFIGSQGKVALFEDSTFTVGDFFRPASNDGFTLFRNSIFTIGEASASGAITGLEESYSRFENCTITHANTTVLCNAAGNNIRYEFIDSDLSASSSSLATFSTFNGHIEVIVRRCKLKASWTAVSGTITNTPAYVLVDGCTDGTITVPELGMTQLETYYGTAKATLAKYRTGGADDGLQANAHSWEMTANANCLEVYNALESPPIALWTAADATPTGATSQGLYQSTRMAINGTPAALTTDGTSTWNGTGVGTKQKITATVCDYTLTVYVASGATLNNDDFWVEVSAPDQVGGPVVVRCFLAKPSTTVYVDPRLEIA